jgi:hypothetical protein
MVRPAKSMRRKKLVQYLDQHPSQIYDWYSDSWAVFRWCELSKSNMKDYSSHLRK